jgi:competence protein ComEA
MNAAEKKVLHVAFALFLVGILVRVLPWGLPSIDFVDIGDRPRRAEPAPLPSKLEYGDAAPVPDTLITDKVIEKPGKEHARKSRKKKAIVHFPLKINSATADELCALKGVGPKLAEKIVAFREAKGPFKTGADLQKVPGIGKKKLEGILQWVIFD